MIAKYRQQGVEGWVLTNFTMEQVEGRIKNLENKLAAKEAELEQEKESRRGNKQAVVDTVGGLVEGKPTNILNYLQRLRELMNKEMELSIERKRADDSEKEVANRAHSEGGEIISLLSAKP